MKIKKLSAMNLKGRTFKHELGDATIITGKNFSGKTARLEALRLALLGYLPEHPKNNPGIFALSSGSTMAVGIEFPDGRAIGREWTQNKKSIKYTGYDGEVVPLVQFNADAYLSLSENERVRYVFNLIPNAGGRTIASLVRDIEGLKFDEKNEHIDNALKKASEIMAVAAETKPSIQEFLNSTIEALKEAQKAANTEIKRMAGTIQGIAQLKLNDQDGPGMSEGDLIEAINEQHAIIDRLNEEKGRLAAEELQAKQSQARRAEILTQIEDIEQSLPPSDVDLTNVSSELQSAKAKLAEYESRAVEMRVLSRKHDAAIAELNGLKASLELLTAKKPDQAMYDDSKRLKSQIEEIEKRCAARNSARNTELFQREYANIFAEISMLRNEMANLTSEHAEIISKDSCPMCGTSHEGWKDECAARFNSKKDKINSRIADLSASLDESKDALEASKASDAADQDDRGKIQVARHLLAQVDAKIAAYDAAQVERLEKKIAGFVTPPDADDLPAIEYEIGGAKKSIDSLEGLERISREAARLPDLYKQLEACPEIAAKPAETIMVLSDLGNARDKLNELNGQLQKIANRKSDEKRMAEAEDEHIRLKWSVKVYGEAVDALIQAQADLMSKAFGPLMETANLFCAGILRSPLEYRSGEIGRFEGATFVPIRCFSGTEQAVTHAAISAALSMNSAAKIILTDEMGRMDSENKRKWTRNISDMISRGEIDQWIGVDVEANAYPDNHNLTIIEI